MVKIIVSAPHEATSGGERGDAEMLSYLRAAASALANQELRQRLRLIINAFDLLDAADGTATKRVVPAEVARHSIFAGGRAFSFGTFQLFPSQRLLLETNKRVQIGSRALDILTILVERAGEVVGKDELMARTWPNVFVDNANLKTQVSALRRALGETHTGRRYIVTVPGRGYNFVVPVSFSDGAALDERDPGHACGHDHPRGDAHRYETGPDLSPSELLHARDPCI